jgi:hypothetical protein
MQRQRPKPGECDGPVGLEVVSCTNHGLDTRGCEKVGAMICAPPFPRHYEEPVGEIHPLVDSGRTSDAALCHQGNDAAARPIVAAQLAEPGRPGRGINTLIEVAR